MQMAKGGAAISIKEFDVWAGSSPLILDVSWQIMPNERWALLGGNGCGKSTLLRAIGQAANGERFEDGELEVAQSLRVGMLEQTAITGSTASVRDEVMSRMGSYQAAKAALAEAEAQCTTGSECELESLEKANADFEAAGGFAVEARVSKVLRGLGFEEGEFDRPCSSFSGGWQMRIGLARLLLSDPELLILDEPTNHLDASARRWLGEYVGEYAGTVLVVSHDEPFVSAAANSIAEVAGGRLELYKSVSHTKFLQEREERQARALSTVERQEREGKRLQDFIDRMGAKASKAKQAKDREGKLAKLEVQMEAARKLIVGERHQPKLTLARPPPCDAVPLRLRGASLRHAEGTQDILSQVALEIGKGMRLVVRGPNGAGKSTLLKAIGGQLALREGERLTDDRLALGFFAQDLAQELPQASVAMDYVAEAVRAADPSIDDTRIRTVMGSLGLVGEKATRQISALSGGEKARVALAVFCLTPSNVILFDEPSNHLDVQSIAALVSALDEYEGAVVVVSHDRAFCEALRCTHVAYVAGGSVTLEERELRASDFSEDDKGVANVDAQAKAQAETEADREERKAMAQLDRKAQKERLAAPKKLKQVEGKIADAEAELEALSAQMLECGSDAQRAVELSEQQAQVQSRVDELYEEWERLEELAAEAV
jgi:ATP-binding cassette subfamily F protein 3